MDLVEYLERLVMADAEARRHLRAAARRPGGQADEPAQGEGPGGAGRFPVRSDRPIASTTVDLHIDRSGDERARLHGCLRAEAKGSVRVRSWPARKDWDDLKANERTFQEAENDRLLYVAATRAGTCLMVAQRE